MKNIIVLFGGKSAEHDISLITANLVLNSIDEEKYKVYPIKIEKDNKWFYIKDFKNNITKNLKKEEIFLKMGENVLYKKSGLLVKKFIKVDCAVLCHHGLNGEDGTIQSVLELCNIPYTSSGVMQSAISMDKVVMKLLFKEFNFNTPKFEYFYKNEYVVNEDNICENLIKKLGFPLIIKPANLGSSIGISVAKNIEELKNSINVALNFDNKILVEEALTNFKEINCAVLSDGKEVIASFLEQPLNYNEFLTFNDKYIKGDKKKQKKIYPAEIDEKLTKEIQKISTEIFKKFELSGVVRIDFMLKEDKIFVNEINSIPGSLAYYLFEKNGLTFSDVIDKLIEGSFVKFNNKNLLNFAYNSNVLQNPVGKK